jgi:hypothetical protein
LLPSFWPPKAAISDYWTSAYKAGEGLKIHVSPVQLRPYPFSLVFRVPQADAQLRLSLSFHKSIDVVGNFCIVYEFLWVCTIEVLLDIRIAIAVGILRTV